MNWQDINKPEDVNGLSFNQIEEVMLQAENAINELPPCLPEKPYLFEIIQINRVIVDIKKELDEDITIDKKIELIKLFSETLEYGFKILNKIKKLFIQSGQSEIYSDFIEFLDKSGFANDSIDIDLEVETDPWDKLWKPSCN